MADTTPRLGLPLIAAGQAQKELFHNEALVRLDAAALATVVETGLDAPPASPAAGGCWIVGAAPTGDWAGQAQCVAIATDGGWRFVAPSPGMTLRRADNGLELRWDGAAWRTGEAVAARLSIGGVQVVGAQLPAVPAPSGGATVDAEARSALAALIVALGTHGLIAT